MKITEKDLRVGNLVMDGKEIVQVNARMIAMLEKKEAEFDPIPLTEELLVDRFGFKLQRKLYSLNVGGELFDYAILDDFVIFKHQSKGWTLDSIEKENTVFFNSVHALQNKFWALKEKELEIKISEHSEPH